jgi:hypothetical protein
MDEETTQRRLTDARKTFARAINARFPVQAITDPKTLATCLLFVPEEPEVILTIEQMAAGVGLTYDAATGTFAATAA